MNQLSIDFSRAARDEGLARAADNAGREWVECAIKDFVSFLKSRVGKEATCEQWRYDWLTRKNPAPASHKAWGSVVNIAARRGLIVNTGTYVTAQSVKTHGHRIPYWRAV